MKPVNLIDLEKHAMRALKELGVHNVAVECIISPFNDDFEFVLWCVFPDGTANMSLVAPLSGLRVIAAKSDDELRDLCKGVIAAAIVGHPEFFRKPLPRECPCGIFRGDCTYHREATH